MLPDSGIDAARERANESEVMQLQLSYYNYSAPTSTVEVKNMDSCDSNNEKLVFFCHRQLCQNLKRRAFNGNRVENLRGGSA